MRLVHRLAGLSLAVALCAAVSGSPAARAEGEELAARKQLLMEVVATKGDLLTRIARCCNPIPGDSILGFVTRARGVTVHKKDCTSLKNEDEPERIVSVSWGKVRDLYPVRVRIDAYDRVGLLRDVTMSVSEERVNIASVVTEEMSDGSGVMELTLHTTGLDQLGKLFAKLEGVRGVTSVTRDRSSLAVPSRT